MPEKSCTCGGSKHVLENGKWVACPCLIVQRLRDRFIETDSDITYLETKLEDFQPRTDAAGEAVKETKHIISLINNKTLPKKPVCYISRFVPSRLHLAAEIAKVAVSNNYSYKVFDLDDIFSIFISKEGEEHHNMKELLQYDILQLNLGVEFPNKATPYLLKTIFRVRSERERFTVITSRIPIEEFGSSYGKECQEIFKDKRRVFIFDLD